jgi:hypothetical protein
MYLYRLARINFARCFYSISTQKGRHVFVRERIRVIVKVSVFWRAFEHITSRKLHKEDVPALFTAYD